MRSAKTTGEKYFGGVENIALITKKWGSRSKPWVLLVFQLKRKQVEDCLQANSGQLLPQAAQLPKAPGTRVKFYLLQDLLLPDSVSGRYLGMQILPILSNSQPCFEQDMGLGDLLSFLSNWIITWSCNPNLCWTNLFHKKADSVRKTVSSTRMESNWCQ